MKKKVKARKTIRKIYKNPKEISFHKLKKGKYYIAEEQHPSRVLPEYRVFIFEHYDDETEEIVGKHPYYFTLMYILYDATDVIHGPFSSIDETLDYGARLKKGAWLFQPYTGRRSRW